MIAHRSRIHFALRLTLRVALPFALRFGLCFIRRASAGAATAGCTSDPQPARFLTSIREAEGDLE
jgi:hypothetical protein